MALLAVVYAGRAQAHDARPLSISINEQSQGLYVAYILIPPSVPAANQPKVQWPSNCKVLKNELQASLGVVKETTALHCTGGLEGKHIAVNYQIYNPSLATLFRVTETSGKVITRVLPPDQLDWQVPKDPGWREVALGYLKLGIGHIWSGVDHLLFVTGLLILAGTFRRVLITITGFTIAHSITLSLSALNLVQVPVAPVEAAIALSILFLAREIAKPHPNGIAERYPILVASSFGLLHGFGFAAALHEVGLPTNELAVGLLCFNLGVEIGQISFIICVLAAIYAGRKFIQMTRMPTIQLSRRLGVIGGYGLGIPAAFWFIQRLGAF
jgi:hydrogenase/urease accessory protein HupE